MLRSLKKHDINWLENNLLDEDCDFIIVSDKEGSVIANKDAPFDLITEIPVDITNKIKTLDFINGIFLTDKGPAIITVANVKNNEGGGEPPGLLIYGRYITKELLSEVKKTSDSDITIFTNGAIVSTLEQKSEIN
ncbi:hypothetical protein Dred_2638 [Desulforamulus reducens MI-1]|uniref:CHASE4 domain-containing protein n=1 Tax=Desulforamulus reducens (strain ATCC BAA-1160 / DSM 100696 / MI-1) TaxID=349161 RepID=A4J7U2_DESRM|nr:hypothetical protein Dred_2638 [Desulforamulus reducens MI-1]